MRARFLRPRTCRPVLKDQSPTDCVWHLCQRKMTSLDVGLIVFSEYRPQSLHNRVRVRKHRAEWDILMVQQKPQLEAWIAHGNLKPGLPRLSHRFECPGKILIPEVVICIQQDPEFISGLNFASTPYVGKSIFQPIDHM